MPSMRQQQAGWGETTIPPEQPLLQAVVSLLPSLHVEALRAETHPAQGTTNCRFPHSTCTVCSRPRVSKMSFWRWAETKHTPEASVCQVPPLLETCSEPSREITSDLVDTYTGEGRTLGLPGVPCPDSLLELE